MADINDDGWADIWIGNHRDLASLYLSNGDGTFTDIIPEYWANPLTPDGHGTAIADIDNDGDRDILQMVGADGGVGVGRNLLLVNGGDRFTEQAAAAHLGMEIGRGRMAAWLDWNSDGLLDVFMSNIKRDDGLGPSTLFTSTGSIFEEQIGVTDKQGSLFAQVSSLGSTESRYLIAQNQFNFPSKIFQLGDMSGKDLSVDMGFPNVMHVGDAGVADFDGDLVPDFYLARLDNSASEVAIVGNQVRARVLLEAEERGYSFETEGPIMVTAQPSWEIRRTDIYIGAAGRNPDSTSFSLDSSKSYTHGMAPPAGGTGVGLYIGYDPASGKWDVDAGSATRSDINILISSSNPVTAVTMRNIQPGDLLLEDKIIVNGRGAPLFLPANNIPGGASACQSIGVGDFDNDMDIDVYLVCRSQTRNYPNRMLLNDGSGKFSELVGAGGAAGSFAGRGDSVAVGDYNNDGFLDLMVTNGAGEEPFTNGPNQLFRNHGNNNNWLQLNLIGLTNNRDGIGARIIVGTPDGKQQFREQNGGYHHSSQDFSRIHVGLGSNSTANIRVEWQNGRVDTWTGVAANSIYDATEGGAIQARVLDAIGPYECGQPDFDTAVDTAFFVWKDCNSGRWTVRVSSADSQVEFSGVLNFPWATVRNVTESSIEASDVFDVSGTRIKFVLKAAVGNYDSFSFDVDEGATACLDFRSSQRVQVAMGSKPYSYRGAIELNGLGDCRALMNRAGPVITKIPAQTFTSGESVRLQVHASDADGDWPTFTAIRLPPGLRIDSESGIISGQPSVEGDYVAKIMADDGRGRQSMREVSFSVSQSADPEPEPPPPTVPENGSPGGGGSISVLLFALALWIRRRRDDESAVEVQCRDLAGRAQCRRHRARHDG